MSRIRVAVLTGGSSEHPAASTHPPQLAIPRPKMHPRTSRVLRSRTSYYEATTNAPRAKSSPTTRPRSARRCASGLNAASQTGSLPPGEQVSACATERQRYVPRQCAARYIHHSCRQSGRCSSAKHRALSTCCSLVRCRRLPLPRSRAPSRGLSKTHSS